MDAVITLFSKVNFFILLPMFCAIGGLVLGFFRNYKRPAEFLKGHLEQITGEIRAIVADQGMDPALLRRRLDMVFEASPFKKIWLEYRQSLHTVDVQNDIKVIFATVPSQTYFSKESMIDYEINADFYRHLPGILTGIGIIGTFTGLVWGLFQFKPDSGMAFESLPMLLQEVTSAFIGSGLAILAAIFITYKEKSILNQCYRLVEQLNKEVDGLYVTGAGEEYLARLVRITENAPATNRALKDALVEDIARLVGHSTERQLELSTRQGEALSAQLALALAAPIAQLSGAVQELAKIQQESVVGMMEKLLGGFMGRIDSAFGQQIQGINLSLQNSTDTIGRVQEAMTRSIGDISSAGTTAADRMAQKLEDSLVRSLTAQEQMNQRTLEQQKKTADILDTAVTQLSAKVAEAVSTVTLAQERIASQALEQQRKSADIVDGAMSKIAEAQTQAARLSSDAARAAQESVVRVTAQADSWQRKATEALEGTLTRLSTKLDDIVEGAGRLNDKLSAQATVLQEKTIAAAESAVGRLSLKLDGVIDGATSAQERAHTLTLDIQRRTSEALESSVARVAGQIGGVAAALDAARASADDAAIEMQKKTADAMESSIARVMQQIATSAEVSNAVLTRVSTTVEDILSGTTRTQEQMSSQVLELQRRSTQTLESAVETMFGKLEDSLSAFSTAQTRLSDTVTLLQEKSARTLEASADKVANRMELALNSAVENQKRGGEIMDTSMRAVLAKLQSALGLIAEDRATQVSQDEQRHEKLLTSAKTLYGGLSGSIERLVADVRAAVSKTGDSLHIMQKTAADAASGMKDSALVIRDAAGTFATAGNTMTDMTGTMFDAAQSLQHTAMAVASSLQEYDRLRAGAQQQIVQLQEMIALMKQENGVNQKLVGDMDRIVASFAQAERLSKDYLGTVNDVLKKSFQDFGAEMVGQVRTVTAETNRQMGASLGALSGTVDSMVASVTKLRRAG